jgi:hypothetical protein
VCVDHARPGIPLDGGMLCLSACGRWHAAAKQRPSTTCLLLMPMVFSLFRPCKPGPRGPAAEFDVLVKEAGTGPAVLRLCCAAVVLCCKTLTCHTLLCCAGIVNVMKDLQQKFGNPPYAVFGGKHMQSVPWLLRHSVTKGDGIMPSRRGTWCPKCLTHMMCEALDMLCSSQHAWHLERLFHCVTPTCP